MELKKQRKAHVKEMKLPPRMAHCVMALNPLTDEIVGMWPNAYRAEMDLGIVGVSDAALGVKERAGLYRWCYVFG